MRAIKAAIVALASAAAITISPSTALADDVFTINHWYYYDDQARWNATTNVLKACDSSPGNGTARAVLAVVGGGTWQVYDDNGAQPGCGSAGPLSVDETKVADLWICSDSSSGSCWGPLRVRL